VRAPPASLASFVERLKHGRLSAPAKRRVRSSVHQQLRPGRHVAKSSRGAPRHLLIVVVDESKGGGLIVVLGEPKGGARVENPARAGDPAVRTKAVAAPASNQSRSLPDLGGSVFGRTMGSPGVRPPDLSSATARGVAGFGERNSIPIPSFPHYADPPAWPDRWHPALPCFDPE
jgi:hypothetical protein